jgi:hypothetical protein
MTTREGAFLTVDFPELNGLGASFYVFFLLFILVSELAFEHSS